MHTFFMHTPITPAGIPNWHQLTLIANSSSISFLIRAISTDKKQQT